MVHLTEVRIVLPFTVEEFRRGQRYANWKTNENATEPGQGGTLLSSTPYYHDVYGEGMFTHSLYRLGNRLPDWVNRLVPPSALVVDEKSWINYPFMRTVITIPFFSKLKMEIVSLHLDDDGSSHNPLSLSDDLLAIRKIDYMDIGSEPVAKRDYYPELDPALVRTKATGRGPLTPGWQKREKTLMCAYKAIRAEADYWGVQTRAEKLLIGSLRQIFLLAHKNCFGLTDEWYHLTYEQVMALEAESHTRLQLSSGSIRGHELEPGSEGEGGRKEGEEEDESKDGSEDGKKEGESERGASERENMEVLGREGGGEGVREKLSGEIDADGAEASAEEVSRLAAGSGIMGTGSDAKAPAVEGGEGGSKGEDGVAKSDGESAEEESEETDDEEDEEEDEDLDLEFYEAEMQWALEEEQHAETMLSDLGSGVRGRATMEGIDTPDVCPVCAEKKAASDAADAAAAVIAVLPPVVFCGACTEFFCDACFASLHCTPRLRQHFTTRVSTLAAFEPRERLLSTPKEEDGKPGAEGSGKVGKGSRRSSVEDQEARKQAREQRDEEMAVAKDMKRATKDIKAKQKKMEKQQRVEEKGRKKKEKKGGESGKTAAEAGGGGDGALSGGEGKGMGGRSREAGWDKMKNPPVNLVGGPALERRRLSLSDREGTYAAAADAVLQRMELERTASGVPTVIAGSTMYAGLEYKPVELSTVMVTIISSLYTDSVQATASPQAAISRSSSSTSKRGEDFALPSLSVWANGGGGDGRGIGRSSSSKRLAAVEGEGMTVVTEGDLEELMGRMSAAEVDKMKIFKALTELLRNVDAAGLSHDEKLVFWINVYNALVMHGYLVYGIPKTHYRRVMFLHKTSYLIDNVSISVLAIEHSILRAASHRPALAGLLPVQRFKPGDRAYNFTLHRAEPLVSFALSCGCASSPPVQAYRVATVRQQLAAAAAWYVGATVDLSRPNRIVLPKLLHWYSKDFAGSTRQLLRWIADKLPSEQRQDLMGRLEKGGGGGASGSVSKTVQVANYDWSFLFRFFATAAQSV